MRRKMLGVTLIELMSVLVILAILASIAIPSYRRYLIRAQRTEATGALLTVQQQQEKFFLQNNRYATGAELSTAPPAGLGINALTANSNYLITLNTPTTTTYVATATPQAGQAAQDPDCQSMTINEQGVRTSTPGAITLCFK
jgi:type IV pilus assembly protein PilE